MAIDFPNTPTIGQTFTADARTWTWNGTSWKLTSYGNQGPQGNQGYQGPQGPTTTALSTTDFGAIIAMEIGP